MKTGYNQLQLLCCWDFEFTMIYGSNPTFMNIIGKSRPEILPKGRLHVLAVCSDSVKSCSKHNPKRMTLVLISTSQICHLSGRDSLITALYQLSESQKGKSEDWTVPLSESDTVREMILITSLLLHQWAPLTPWFTWQRSHQGIFFSNHRTICLVQNLLKLKLNGFLMKGLKLLLLHLSKVGYTPSAEAFRVSVRYKK